MRQSANGLAISSTKRPTAARLSYRASSKSYKSLAQPAEKQRGQGYLAAFLFSRSLPAWAIISIRLLFRHLNLPRKQRRQYYGGMEAGGTKSICAVAANPTDTPVETISIPTSSSAKDIIQQAINFYKKYDLKALGVASFGPIDLNPTSPTYGYITATPKPGWANTDLLGPLRQALGVPIGFDTDVNGAALGEWRYGGGQGLDSVVYFTVGTGIGGGAVLNGQARHGFVHPEMGHLPVRRHRADRYPGWCTYHKDCLEGLATGPAIADRWQKPATELPIDHQAWEFEAYYLAQAVCSVVYTLSPHRVILGAGVIHQQQPFPPIPPPVFPTLNRYIP